MIKCIDFGVKIPWMQMQALPFTRYEDLAKLCNLYMPRFPQLYVKATVILTDNGLENTGIK